MAAPLTLRLRPKKFRTLAGEGIVIEIAHQVFADLDMETVELNRSRTSVRITPLTGDGETMTLSGAGHVALHRVHPLSEVGRRFRAPAGSAWTSDLQLLQYARPLAVGRYSIQLNYRYGDSPEETVTTNAVEVEVAPANLLNSEFRWFGESAPRDTIATLWTAREDRDIHWMFQTARGKDPNAILTAVDLELPDPPHSKPRLAHLNDTASFHYERYAVWVDGESLGWLKTSDEQRLGEPASASHGLGSAPQLADPPLQRRGGGFFAVLAGWASREPSLSLIEVDDHGTTQRRILPARESAGGVAVVAWSEGDETAAGNVFLIAGDRHSIVLVDLSGGTPQSLAAPGEVVTVAVDQWLGRGKLLALVRRGGLLEVIAWDLSSLDAAPQLMSRYDLETLPPGFWSADLVDVVPLDGSCGLALLSSGRDGWAILSQGKTYRLARAEGGGTPKLVATRSGLFLVQHFADRGFAATRLGEAPPPDPI
jgi:hypothetical protein